MQRTAPDASQPSSPATDSQPPSAKRTKIAHSGLAQRNALGASQESESRPLGSNTTETMWTLPVAPNENATLSDAESSDDELAPWQVGAFSTGRMTFGKVSEKAQVSRTYIA